MDKLINAYDFAANKHGKQIRKNNEGLTYVVHLTDVAKILWEAGVTDLDVICAGILHDTIEDTKTSKDELVSIFGQRIADIVEECSDNKKLSKIERKKTQIIHAEHISKEAKMVKLADKISNASGIVKDPPKNWSPVEMKGYVDWCYAVVNNLKGVNVVMEDTLAKLFDGYGLTGMDVNSKEFNDRLDVYYKHIDKSD